MTIRVRPTDLVVPQDDPFQNYLLDRKPSIENLTDLLGTVRGPCVLALDSKWGGGKTTFLRMWTAHVRKEGYFVADFNAWETDHSSDPFVALSSTLQKQFQASTSDGRGVNFKRLAEDAKKVALSAAPIMAGVAATAAFGSGAWATEAVSQLTSYTGDRLEEYRKGQEAIDNFRATLGKETLRISNNQYNGRSLFIMIDELDRCRPFYAIELLEVAKHLFSVDRIVFVLALNRRELAHSVRALYGVEFDAEGYLHRFFDLDYTLPSPNREKFVLQAIRDTGLSTYFPDGTVAYEAVPNMIARMLSASKLDLRRIAQTIRRLSLICPPPGRSSTKTAAAASVGLILRTLDADLYTRFCNFECGDDEVVRLTYSYGEIKSIQDSPEGHVFEAIVSLMWCEISVRFRDYTVRFDESPLLSGYKSTLRKLYDRRPRVEFSQEDEAVEIRCRGTIDAARIMSQDGCGLFCSEALNRIELLPTDDA